MSWKSGAIGLAIGVFLGGGVVWAFASKAAPARRVLTKDLDIEAMYFFSPKSGAPVKGVIRAGSEYEVDGRYSNADYIVFRTVVDRQQITSMSKPAPPESSERKK
jgi:hypothetical protein